MTCLIAILAPLALTAADPMPQPALAATPAGYDKFVRLSVALGWDQEIRTWSYDQDMLLLSFTPSLRWGHLVAGLEASLHTTGVNDEKTDLGLSLGGALDLTRTEELRATLDVGYRSQTKLRLEGGGVFFGPERPGIDGEHAYVGVTVELDERQDDGGLAWGVKAFARFDATRAYVLSDNDGESTKFGGTAEVGMALSIGFDAPLR